MTTAEHVAITTDGVVTGGHPEVAEAGAEILGRGGNAVDAAVAAFFTSFHAEPMLASPAGGGFLVAEIGGEATAWDFFAAAPGLGAGDSAWRPARDDAFYGVEVDFGSARQTFHIGAGSVAVPGALVGLCQVQREAGRLRLAEVLEPAIRACAGGTMLSRMSHFVLRLLEPIVRANAEQAAYLTHDDGRLLSAGETWTNPDLASFYEQLAIGGLDEVLSTGPMGDALVGAVQAGGGGITRDDLDRYEVGRTPPLTWTSRTGDRLMLAAPPSSGGMLIAYGMALLESLPAVAPGSREDVLRLRAVMAETLRARAEIIGPRTPTMAHAEALLDGASIEQGIRRLHGLLELGPGALPAPSAPDNRVGNTTHVSVIDAAGDACSVTISNGECSGVVVPGTGIFLNNFLGEEDLNPCGFHRFAPGARLGSTMTPTLLRRPDGAVTALGSGGSNRIRTALLQVAARHLLQGLELDAAVRADRTHYEDQMLYAESTHTLRAALDTLQAEGLRMSRFDAQNMFFGGVHVARLRADGLHDGLGDERRSGATRVVERI